MVLDLCFFADDYTPDAALMRMRSQRNRLLAESDWTQLADAPVNPVAWAEYRQGLRDAPDSWTPGLMWDAPTPPE